jgi:hypothetical protein
VTHGLLPGSGGAQVWRVEGFRGDTDISLDLRDGDEVEVSDSFGQAGMAVIRLHGDVSRLSAARCGDLLVLADSITLELQAPARHTPPRGRQPTGGAPLSLAVAQISHSSRVLVFSGGLFPPVVQLSHAAGCEAAGPTEALSLQAALSGDSSLSLHALALPGHAPGVPQPPRAERGSHRMLDRSALALAARFGATPGALLRAAVPCVTHPPRGVALHCNLSSRPPHAFACAPSACALVSDSRLIPSLYRISTQLPGDGVFEVLRGRLHACLSALRTGETGTEDVAAAQRSPNRGGQHRSSGIIGGCPGEERRDSGSGFHAARVQGQTHKPPDLRSIVGRSHVLQSPEIQAAGGDGGGDPSTVERTQDRSSSPERQVASASRSAIFASDLHSKEASPRLAAREIQAADTEQVYDGWKVPGSAVKRLPPSPPPPPRARDGWVTEARLTAPGSPAASTPRATSAALGGAHDPAAGHSTPRRAAAARQLARSLTSAGVVAGAEDAWRLQATATGELNGAHDLASPKVAAPAASGSKDDEDTASGETLTLEAEGGAAALPDAPSQGQAGDAGAGAAAGGSNEQHASRGAQHDMETQSADCRPESGPSSPAPSPARAPRTTYALSSGSPGAPPAERSHGAGRGAPQAERSQGANDAAYCAAGVAPTKVLAVGAHGWSSLPAPPTVGASAPEPGPRPHSSEAETSLLDSVKCDHSFIPPHFCAARGAARARGAEWSGAGGRGGRLPSRASSAGTSSEVGDLQLAGAGGEEGRRDSQHSLGEEAAALARQARAGGHPPRMSTHGEGSPRPVLGTAPGKFVPRPHSSRGTASARACRQAVHSPPAPAAPRSRWSWRETLVSLSRPLDAAPLGAVSPAPVSAASISASFVASPRWAAQDTKDAAFPDARAVHGVHGVAAFLSMQSGGSGPDFAQLRELAPDDAAPCPSPVGGLAMPLGVKVSLESRLIGNALHPGEARSRFLTRAPESSQELTQANDVRAPSGARDARALWGVARVKILYQV